MEESGLGLWGRLGIALPWWVGAGWDNFVVGGWVEGNSGAGSKYLMLTKRRNNHDVIVITFNVTRTQHIILGFLWYSGVTCDLLWYLFRRTSAPS